MFTYGNDFEGDMRGSGIQGRLTLIFAGDLLGSCAS